MVLRCDLAPDADAAPRLRCRRHAAFKGARPSVRVFAEGEQQQKAPRAPKEAKTYAVQIEDVKEGQEYQGTVVRGTLLRTFQSCFAGSLERGF